MPEESIEAVTEFAERPPIPDAPFTTIGGLLEGIRRSVGIPLEDICEHIKKMRGYL